MFHSPLFKAIYLIQGPYSGTYFFNFWFVYNFHQFFTVLLSQLSEKIPKMKQNSHIWRYLYINIRVTSQFRSS